MKKQKKEESLPVPTPTEQQFSSLNQAYQYFNRELFGGQLPGCILNFSRKRNAHGFMAAGRWRKIGEQSHTTHEIALTHITLHREPKLVFSTLVHEQVHLWQVEFGNPSRSGYHNQEWAEKMEEIGLMPSENGEPGGKKTGQHMTHYIISGGMYELAFDKIPPDFLLPFTSLEGDVMNSLLTGAPLPAGVELTAGKKGKGTPLPSTARNKTKYNCPGCKSNVWGKPSMNLICGNCNETFVPV